MYFSIIEKNRKSLTKCKENTEHVFYQYILSGDNFSFRLLLTKICSPEANNWAIKCNAQRSQVLIPTSDYKVILNIVLFVLPKWSIFPHFYYKWRNQTASMSSEQHSDLYRHLSGNKTQEHFVTNPPTCKASACSTRKHNLCKTWLCAPEVKPRLYQMAQPCFSLPCLDFRAKKGCTCWGRGRRMTTAGI